MAHESLKQLWTEAYEAFIFPGGVRFVTPIQSVDTPYIAHGFPSDYGFAITAYNPAHPDFPQCLSQFENQDQNIRLRDDLDMICHRSHSGIYPSFGFGEGEWREDGFVITCNTEQASLIESQVLSLARKYGQGAIYRYRRKNELSLSRETLPAFDLFEDTRSEVDVTGVNPPPDWTGNPNWPKYIWHPTLFGSSSDRF
jgi:hypothetical protein